jgi:hypothetical protein
MGDRSQPLHHLLAAHADAVVFDGQRFVVGIDLERDAQRRIIPQQLRLSDGFIAQLFTGIGRVRDLFAQKDLFVGVDRVHDQVQQPGDIGIECAALLAHFIDDSHAGIPLEVTAAQAPDGGGKG